MSGIYFFANTAKNSTVIRRFVFDQALLLCFFCGLFSGAADGQNTVFNLETGVPVEKKLDKEEVQTFRFKAQTNDFVRISVQQKRADVGLQLLNSTGTQLLEINNSNAREEDENLSFIAENGDDFQLKITYQRSLPGTADEPGYGIKLETVAPATERDKAQVAAERLYQKANLLRFQAKAEPRRESVKVFNDATALFVQAGDKKGEAFVYFGLGQILSLLGDFPNSRVNFEKAIQIFRVQSIRPALASALQIQAAVYFAEGSSDKAAELCQEALKIYRELGDKTGEAQISGNLGVIYERSAQPRKALELYLSSLPILQASGDRPGEARLLSSIGSVYHDVGEPALALENYEKALKIRREIGDKRTVAFTLANMALTYKLSGNFPKLIELLDEARQIFSERGEKPAEAVVLNNLSGAYQDLNDIPKARELAEKSLDLNKQLQNKDTEAAALSNLASLELGDGNFQKALDIYTQASNLFSSGTNKRQQARTLVKIGEVNIRLGNREKALATLNQALPVLREIEDKNFEEYALYLLGEINRLDNKPLVAKQLLLQSMAMKEQVGDKPTLAQNLLSLAKTEQSLQNLPQAREYIERAISLIESIRIKVSRQDLRASYFAAQQEYYEFYIDILMAQHKLEPDKGFSERALQISETARARNLLEALGTNQAEIRAGVSRELFDERQKLIQKINAKEFQKVNALRLKQTENARILEREIAELVPQLRAAEAKIRQQSPQFAALTQINPPTLKEIQASLLDDSSVLLEYFLGEEHSYLFAVSKNDFKVYDLPPKAELEKSARKFHAGLVERSLNVPDETLAKRQERIEQADNFVENSSLELSRKLLAPVAQTIKNKRLLIVASDVLSYVSFATLPNPSSLPVKTKSQFLIETNELVYLPSAAALAMIRKVPVKPGTNLISVLADPVFSETDKRVKAAAGQKKDDKLNQQVASKLPSTLRGELGRLRFSRQEAEAISALVPENNRLIALDFNASLATAKTAGLDKSKIIHFSTHGFVRSDFPELSGIVLSLVNEKGELQDGILRLQEIYNLDLNAELVVLSACETALGKEIKGEGLVGLTHGFLTAGSRRVVASLWRVDDKATSELMRRFYQGMLKDGLRPADALRKAQVSLIQDKSFGHPFYWAAFTLQGDYH